MLTATVTSKGQITIPKAVRSLLRLQTGDRVAFSVCDGAEAVMKPISKSVDDVFGKLCDKAQKALSVEDMNRAVAERFKGVRYGRH